MARIYTNFKDKWINKRVDFDWAFWYQCVDLFKQYVKECIGIILWKTGNANEIRQNKYHCFDSKWSKIPGTKDLMQWDIILFNMWQYWHIGIVDRITDWKINVLDQNWGNVQWTNWEWDDSIKIHKYDIWDKRISGVWRCEKIFENLQQERAYIDAKLSKEPNDKNTLDYKSSIRYKVL